MILYHGNDMVKLGCNDCMGCSECCRGMGDSIILDPYDMYQLQRATGETFSQLLQGRIELHVENGIVLPSLVMQPDTGACGFLTAEGRCGIHAYRPGLCRAFPLGRNYGEDGLSYFLLEDACQIKNRTKLKIKKWIDVPAMAQYEKFLVNWHMLRKHIMEAIEEKNSDDYAQAVNVKLLELFYQKHYDTEADFYGQFEERRVGISLLYFATV